MKKKAILCVIVIAMMLSGIVPAYAVSNYTMTYLPGTTDTVTNLPAADGGIGSEAYTVSSQIPQRQGYEFICWTLDYGMAYGDLTVSKALDGNGADSTKAFDFTVTLGDTSVSGTYGDMSFTNGVATFSLKGGESKTAEDLPAGITYTVTEADYSTDGYETTKTGDTGSIAEGMTATAAFTNKRIVYRVTYVVNPDKTYGKPEGSTVPTDPTEYAPKDYVKVHDQLTTTVDYAYNEKGENVKGTWKFETWDKADFEITEDTTITGGWVFTPAPTTKYHYYVEYWLWDGKKMTQQVHAREEVEIDSLGITRREYAIPLAQLKKPYSVMKNGKYQYYIVTPYQEKLISKDGYIIYILYAEIPKGQ